MRHSTDATGPISQGLNSLSGSSSSASSTSSLSGSMILPTDPSSDPSASDQKLKQQKLKLKLKQQQQQPSMPPISKLPPELMAHIFKFLTNKADKYTTFFVCKYWFAVSVDSFWLRPNFVKEKQVMRVVQVLKRARIDNPAMDPAIFELVKELEISNPEQEEGESAEEARVVPGNEQAGAGTATDGQAPNQNQNQDQDEDLDQEHEPQTDNNSDEELSDNGNDTEVETKNTPQIDEEDPLALIPLTVPYHLMIRRVNLTSVPRFITDKILINFAVCANLERLTVVGCSKLSDKSLIPIITNCNRILSVDMTGLLRVTDATFLAFSQHCKKLQALYAPGCKELTDKGVSSLALACTGLKRIKLNGCEKLTDDSVLDLINNCPALVELDLSNVPQVTNTSMTQSLLKLSQLREFRMAMNPNINDNAVLQLTDPNAVAPEITEPIPPILGGPQQLPLIMNPQLNSINNSSNNNNINNPNNNNTNSMQNDHPSRSSSPPPALLFDKLRVVDFSNCILITDITIKKLVSYAPKLRSVTLAKCSNVTDRALASLADLGRNLHYIHLGHCSNVTNRGVSALVRACTRIEYIDVASCSQLTDSAVKDLASLPKLRRVGLVKCQQITDAAIYAFAQRGFVTTSNGTLVQTDNPLERVHLSYCSNITVGAITHLLNACPKLTHLSLSGVPSFLVDELRQFCRQPPDDFTQHQQSIFCVFSSNGVKELRNYLNFRQSEQRNQHAQAQQQAQQGQQGQQQMLPQHHGQLLQLVNQAIAASNDTLNINDNNNTTTNININPNQNQRRFIPGPALFDQSTGLLIEIQLVLEGAPANGNPAPPAEMFNDSSIRSILHTSELVRRQVLVHQLMNGVGLPELLQHQQQLALGNANFEVVPANARRPRHGLMQSLSLSRRGVILPQQMQGQNNLQLGRGQNPLHNVIQRQLQQQQYQLQQLQQFHLLNTEGNNGGAGGNEFNGVNENGMGGIRQLPTGQNFQNIAARGFVPFQPGGGVRLQPRNEGENNNTNNNNNGNENGNNGGTQNWAHLPQQEALERIHSIRARLQAQQPPPPQFGPENFNQQENNGPDGNEGGNVTEGGNGNRGGLDEEGDAIMNT